MKLFTPLVAMLFAALPFSSSAIDTENTRMMTSPVISETHLAFTYANDLWIANKDGSNPIRLTVNQGNESRPSFSPDGSMIAFTGNYDGNTDIYVIPTTGGIPKRLTYHPGSDYALEFTPDGKSILFFSQRDIFTNRYLQFFTVEIETGEITKLVIPNGFKASYSPDGKFLAYTPIAERFNQWKNYRGGTVSRIWIFDFEDNSVVEVPKPETGSNDTDPMWYNGKLYFNSDRNGEFNIFSYDLANKAIEQHTDYKDFPVKSPRVGNNGIVYTQAGYIYFMDNDHEVLQIKVGISADLLEVRPRYVSGSKWMNWYNISPSGVRAVFDMRGEIITVPVENGDYRNLTQTQSAHERFPSWSPDGKWIAYFSDETGENQLHLSSQDGKEKKNFKLDGNGFYAYPHWSPDSKKIAYVDNGRVLYVIDISSGKSTRIDADEVYLPGPYRDLFGGWSGDSKWITYSKVLESNFKQVLLYDVDGKQTHPVSDGMSDATSPVFDREGKYLFFFASTDAGPVVNWFDQSSIDMESSYSIYLATLNSEAASPFLRDSDEEEIEEEDDEENKENEEEESEEDESWNIEVEGIQNRIVDVPLPSGNYDQLTVSSSGDLLYIDRTIKYSDQPKLYSYSISDQEPNELGNVDSYELNAKGDMIMFSSMGSMKVGSPSSLGDAKPVDISSVQILVNPVEEWNQILDEVWRINRDYFYDPGMHGADWKAMKKKYSPFIEDCASRSDVNRVIQGMLSELSVGHSYSGGGDFMFSTKYVRGGLLGCDYEKADGRYKFSKIFGGLNWNPNMRSPLTEPGVNVKVGEYLLAVNGKEVTAEDNIYAFFENTAGKITTITVGSSTKASDGREVQVVPISNEYSLRNRDWVEGNIKRVHEATNGQVAYVYVPNTAGAGHEYFKRYFFPQATKKAIIIDERFNGGGLLADYYIDILLRPYQSHWNFRYGKDLKSPSASIQGPKVMLIDETAGSGGDMLPYMFRKFNVGTMVGKRTWGGLVGILGFPALIDGGYVTSPNVAIWTEDGFIVENVGVAPDVEVEQTPAKVIQGKDPQLEKAIQIILGELGKNPPVEPERPAYPTRAKR